MVKSDLVDVNELTFLSQEEERHVHRSLQAEALAHYPKKKDLVMVRVGENCNSVGMGTEGS